jgi:hypothetical protein
VKTFVDAMRSWHGLPEAANESVAREDFEDYVRIARESGLTLAALVLELTPDERDMLVGICDEGIEDWNDQTAVGLRAKVLALAEPRRTNGHTTVQFHQGGLIARPIADDPWTFTHLAIELPTGGVGPIVCGIDRHAARQPDGTLTPGWSVGGGVAGSSMPFPKCPGCDAGRDKTLEIHGLNAFTYAEGR